MNRNKAIKEALSPLLNAPHADRWPAIRQELLHREVRVVSKPVTRHRLPIRTLALCAVTILAILGTMIPLLRSDSRLPIGAPISSNAEASEDIVVVNEVEAVPNQSSYPITLSKIYTEELSLEDVFAHLNAIVPPQQLPSDIQFRRDLFEKKTTKLTYDSEGSLLVHPSYNVFYFFYTAKDNPVRKVQISCSKTIVPEGEIKYTLLEESSQYNISVINNLEVKIGHLWMKQNFEYSTEYEHSERYVAEFTVAGIHTQVVSDNLTLEEFVTTVKSMIR